MRENPREARRILVWLFIAPRKSQYEGASGYKRLNDVINGLESYYITYVGWLCTSAGDSTNIAGVCRHSQGV